ncbi:MAG: HAMP domain-containing histidine kinase, partial [Deltaproteobacteria bacterium]|nr:HAMP domain-containing histidine kinase [Deltaproteobacteria bacterium]
MDNQQQEKSSANRPDPDVERRFLGVLSDHCSSVYFVKTLEGFVHNLNSPLQILWMRSEQMQQDLSVLQDAIRRDDHEEIVTVSERMTQRFDSFMKGFDQLNESLQFLTRDLLGKERCEIGDVDVNDAIRDVLFLLKADMFFKHRVDVRSITAEELPRVRGRHSDFCVMLLHLIQNALDAMAQSESRILTIETVSRGNEVLVRVKDTGVGIAAEDAPRIFAP